MSNGNGHSWSKFFWRDWSADKALHPCSLAAKGFWIEILCIMHEGTPTGHLTLNGKPATLKQMAANAYCTEKDAKRYLAELEEAGVFSRTEDGTIYCRRMVKDAAASDDGRQWAEKRWKGQKPNGTPNGGGNGSPNGRANGHPNGNPNAKNLEAEAELEAEEDSKKDFKILEVGEGCPAREADLAPSVAGPAPAADLVAAIARSKFTNYPPRKAVRTVNEMRDAVTPKPKLRDVSFTREQINAALRKTA
jgi:hypothetical protein